MIAVVIYINNVPIMARSACNMNEANEKGETMYKSDDGKTIWHPRKDGAAKLAILMLKNIKEPS